VGSSSQQHKATFSRDAVPIVPSPPRDLRFRRGRSDNGQCSLCCQSIRSGVRVDMKGTILHYVFCDECASRMARTRKRSRRGK
jgi:hypothetical protein